MTVPVTPITPGTPTSQTASQERRPVTVVFADVVDSTSLAERMDPEDWSGAIRSVLDLMSVPIERYGGTVAQRMGDGLLAIFGAPVAHEDDAIRAVQAALEMVETVADAAPGLRQAYGRELGDGPKVRVGINTGLAIVEGMGDRTRDVDALGDTVNVAARMQSAARPNTVLATGDTWRYAGSAFEGTSLGGVQVKGKSEPVDAWEVTARRDQPGSGRGLAGLRSVMVGRDQELAQLTSLLGAIRAGRGRAATLIGEPGVGKSRLLAELRRAASEQHPAPRWLEARCISYGENVPYGLVDELIATALALPPASMPDERVAMLDQHAREIFGESWHEALTTLRHLLALPLQPAEAAEIAPLSPSALRSRYASALLKVMRIACAAGPTVLVIEDAHWADASSVELVGELLPLAHELPVLMLLTSRPERNAAGWRLVQSARETFGEALAELPLTPLDANTSRLLIGNLLDIDSLPERLRLSIMERSEGNPFFVEELIRMLIERGWVERQGNHWVGSGTVAQAEVPDTLRGLLLGRIDRLSDEARRTLRMASVIGRDVPVRLLEQITADTAETSRALGQAEAAGLLRFAVADPEPIYRFRHVLIQEAAYDSLLKADRRRLHRRVGETLEAEAGEERREELAPILGLHFERAGDGEKAVDYLLMAGRAALRRRALDEAQELLERAARTLDDAAESPDNDRRWINVAIERAAANVLGAAYEADLARLDEAERRATGLGDARLLGRVLARQAGTRAFSEAMYRMDNPEQKRIVERALEIGRRLDDPEILASPSALKGIELVRAGKRSEAVPVLEQAVDALERYQVNEASFYAAELALTYAELGDLAKSDSELVRARNLAERSGDPKALADIEIFTGMLLTMQGRHEEAHARAKLGLDLAIEAKEPVCMAMGAYLSGTTALDIDGPVPAIQYLDRASAYAANAKSDAITRMCDLASSAAKVMAYSTPEDVRDLNRLVEETQAAQDPLDEGFALLRRSKALASIPGTDPALARADAAAAVAIFEKLGTPPYLSAARDLLAELPPAS